MYQSKFFKHNYVRTAFPTLIANYSRRSARNTSSYKLIKSNNVDADVENGEFGSNPNWELFGLRGFRFYLPGSVGPGWLDQSTTAHVKTRSIILTDVAKNGDNNKSVNKLKKRKNDNVNYSVLQCVAQECPLLLRKGIMELFPGCIETSSPQLTIVTITQKLNPRMIRWNKELETERLSKNFLLAASDICTKLKIFGYWADFINPFSGQPYFSQHRSNILYKTDERFRCIGFKVNKNSACKIISYENKNNELNGSLYTSAPPNAEFLQDVMTSVADQ